MLLRSSSNTPAALAIPAFILTSAIMLAGCPEAAEAPACANNRIDIGETGVDCGGSCGLCPGEACNGDAICASLNCSDGQCAVATCNDGIRNGLESGIDCGGPCSACMPAPDTTSQADTSPTLDVVQDTMPSSTDVLVPDTAVAPDVAQDSEVHGNSDADTIQAETCSCLAVGQSYRLDLLALTSFDQGEHAVVETLNALWASDIEHGELNVVLEVTAMTSSTVTMRAVAGAQAETSDGVCDIASSLETFVFSRDGCRLGPSTPGTITVYAGTQDHPKYCSTTLPTKHILHIDAAVLEGRLDEACTSIQEGKVSSGVIGKTELGQVCACILVSGAPAEDCGALEPSYGADGPCPGCNDSYQSLTDLITAFGEVSWSCAISGGGPATCLTADFLASRISQTPPACQQPQR